MSDDQLDEYELEATPVSDEVEKVRARVAEGYMQRAVQPTGLEPKPPGPPVRWPLVVGVFTFPWYRTSLATWAILCVGLTLAGLCCAACYHFLTIHVALGRVIGLPAGIITAAAVSYASAAALAIVEATSEGYRTVEDWPDGTWQDWFWTLPATLGMALPVGMVAYVVALVPGVPFWIALPVALWLLYPPLELSTLETGKLSLPFSPPVLRTLRTQPGAWALFYLESAAVWSGFFALAVITFIDPPYVTILFIGPALASCVMIYARLLGRLAWCISTEKES